MAIRSPIFLSYQVKVCESTKLGRHIVALQDIQPGTLILDELPYALTVDVSLEALLCDYCTEAIDSDITHVLCDDCHNERLVYCSADCRHSAFETYHKWECSEIYDLLHQLRFHKALLAQRILVQTDVKQICDQNQMPLNDDSLLKLTSDEDTVGKDSAQVWKALTAKMAALLTKSGFMDRTNWPNNPSTSEREQLVAEYLLKIMHRFSRNWQWIWEYQDLYRAEKKNSLNQELKHKLERNQWHKACALYPTGALFNHSCLPNVNMVFLTKGRAQFWTVKKIAKGEQILNNYGMKFGHADRAERQKVCSDNYGFVCHCEACTQPAYLQIERQKQGLLCPKCGSEIYLETDYQCDRCEFTQKDWVDEQKENLTNLRKRLQPEQKPDMTIDALVEELQVLETAFHTNNHALNELRAACIAWVLDRLDNDTAKTCPAIQSWLSRCGRSHLASTKRLFAPHSRRTAQALFLLARVYSTVDNKPLQMVTMSAAFRIYYCHFGPDLVKKLFD